MATLVPLALQAITAFQAVTSVAKVFNSSSDRNNANRLALQQLQQRQDTDQRIAVEKAALDKQKIAAETEKVEVQRRLALKRAVARQRAKFGGQGVSSGDGSSEAVLLGLFEESEEQKSSRERLDNIRNQAIDDGLLSKRRVNTLTRTQLAEKQKLTDTSSALGMASDLFSIF